MNGSWNGGLMRFVGFAVAMIAFLVVAALAVVFAATIVVSAVIASALIGLSALALRARGATRVRSHVPEVIEARRVGHTWVAYGWNERR
ncbi:MAG: hypothetical protein M3M95_07110 [Pseudomonadota bacterium]|nr:hypothetical protein [Pseudomonadota bacterium]